MEAVYQRHDGDATLKMLDEITGLYVEVHNKPEHQFPHYRREGFIDRTADQCARDGFELVSLRVDNQLVGFSFGIRFDAGKWWADTPKPPAAILDATKLTVVELDVDERSRGQGFGRQLMNRL